MFGWKKKVDKAAWAEDVYQKKIMRPENEPDEKLSKLTTFMLEQHHRIILESVQIALSTKSADTRKGRVDLSRQHYQEMLKLKPFCNKEQIAMIRDAEIAMKQL